MPGRCCSSRRRSRTCACTVTSSAVVGSSAIRSFGLAASAIASIARWHIPPLNCAGSRARVAAPHRDPDRSSISTARSTPPCGTVPRCRTHLGDLVADGERRVEAASGSWKIMRDLARRVSGGHSLRRPPGESLPSNLIEPPETCPRAVRIRPRTASAVTVLPEPDSPTRPSVLPSRG